MPMMDIGQSNNRDNFQFVGEKSRQKKIEYCLPLVAIYFNSKSATFFIFRNQ